MKLETLYIIPIGLSALALQYLLVTTGNPESVWFWCSILHLCEVPS